MITTNSRRFNILFYVKRDTKKGEEQNTDERDWNTKIKLTN